ELPAFVADFYLDDPKQDAYDAESRTWRFVYRLKPRRAEVNRIPDVPFVFYDPQRKLFQTPYTDEIPLQVTAAPPPDRPPHPVPDLFLQSAPPSQVLGRGEPWSLPSVPVLAALLLAPPLVCAGWYV